MKIKLLAFLMLATIAITVSCTKDGLQGPEGPAGEQGPAGANGAAGPAGPAGSDGSIIYSGTGNPAASTGKNGDYYLDRSSGNLYGPKTESGWGAAINLKGAQGNTGAAGAPGPAGAAGPTGATGAQGPAGATGAAGSQIISGTGNPASSIGAAGDYYLDKSTSNLYGPKATTWGTPTMLRGAQGAQGPIGPAGTDGSIIYSGTGAPDALLGANNDYYFNKANGALYGPKTSRGWGTATSLVGPQGVAGANGNTILNGSGAPVSGTGKVGDFYLDLSTYMLWGPKAVSGWDNRTLLRGAQGPQGPVGPAGADGSIIYSGSGTPDPSIGKTGDYYFDTATSNLWGPKVYGGWLSRTSLKGATGATGAIGATGATGTAGNTILNGFGAPDASTGRNGDFYLDVSTYLLYGPKNADGWRRGVSLRAASGSSTSITAFETADATTLNWIITPGIVNTSGFPSSFTLQQHKSGAVNDTSSVFRLPDSVANIMNHGIVLVYMHLTSTTDNVSNWVQLSYNYTNADVTVQQLYNYRSIINPAGVFIKISCNVINQSRSFPSLLNVDKVRVMVVPQNIAGTLESTRNRPGMQQVMQKLNLTDNSFKKVR